MSKLWAERLTAVGMIVVAGFFLMQTIAMPGTSGTFPKFTEYMVILLAVVMIVRTFFTHDELRHLPARILRRVDRVLLSRHLDDGVPKLEGDGGGRDRAVPPDVSVLQPRPRSRAAQRVVHMSTTVHAALAVRCRGR
jgi:hypothetical protein